MQVTLDNIVFELQRVGGISKGWAKQLQYLLSSGIRLQVIEGPRATKNIFRADCKVPTRVLVSDGRAPAVFRRYRPVRVRDGDIFHSSYYRVPTKKVSSVVTIHDFIYERFERSPRKWAHICQKAEAIRRAAAIVCVSNHTKYDLLRFYSAASKKPIFVIHNGVDDEFRMEASSTEYTRLAERLLPRQKFLLYVGNRGYCKDFPLAVDLFAELHRKVKELNLLVVGGGELTSTELNEFRKRGLDPHEVVVCVQSMSVAKLNVAYNAAFALLFPSRYEGFGIPVLEAARCGCPVLAANTSSIPEVLGDDYPLLFVRDDQSSIRRAIASLLDSNVRAEAVEQGLRRSMSFSWRKMGAQVVEVYASLLETGQ